MEQVYLIDTDNSFVDNYVNVMPGEPYLLLPYGELHKGDRVINITKELASKFRLPHFKPPIKRGSHAEDAPAIGHLVGLEVREDGLYGVPEITDQGDEVMKRGDYRYHSPEVIWEGAYQDPKTGKDIEGPLIVGDALLHTPHMGEAAALYSYTIKEKHTMSEETMVQVPVPQSFLAKLFSKPEEPEQESEGADNFAAQIETLQSERDDFKTKYEKLQSEQEKVQKLSAIKSEFDTDEFGAAFKGLGEKDGTLDMLASMTEEQRAWAVQEFKALSGQINESALIDEKGSDEEAPEITKEAFKEAIDKYQAEHKDADYNAAMDAVLAETPDFAALYKRG